MGLRNYYLTMDDLIEKEGKSKEEIKAEKDKLARDFKKILEELGFTREMIAWFRSGQKDNVPSGREGYYIFSAGDKKEVKNKLNELIASSDGTHSRSTYNNMRIVINNLQELLPFTKNEGWLDNLPSEQIRMIIEFFSLIDRIEIYNEYKGEAKIKKEFNKIAKNIEKIKESKVIILENLQEPPVEEKVKDYNDRKRRIGETVITFFLKKMNNTYFVGMPLASKEKFYRVVKNWCELWICLLESIDGLRKAENFYNMCELLDFYGKDEEYKKRFFREKWQMEDKIKEAYDKFQKLPIIKFVEYYYTNYDNQKLLEMMRVSQEKKLLEKEPVLNTSKDCLEFCSGFVQCVGQWKYEGSYKEDVISMKVEALRELDIITKSIQNDGDIIEHEKVVITEENNKADRKRFVDNYNKYKSAEPVRTECLECIFHLKYENRGLITDYLPYAKDILKDFWEKQIENEGRSEKE